MAVEVAAGPRARARAWSIVRAVPVWAWLTGIVVLSAGIRYALSRHAVAPWIMVDELIYSELAKSFAASGDFLVRDHSTGAYGYVYPALISPAWAAFKAVPDAYAAAKGINALVMSLAAVPAYFLARRVLSPWLSLAAAALTVAVPSMVYTSTLMTENAFYPIFLTGALALVLWLERPTFFRFAVLVLLCLLAFLTRAQAIAFLPAVLTAPFLVYGRSAYSRYRSMYWFAAGAVVLVVIVQEARGASLLGIFGAYQAAGSSDYTVGAVTRWFLYHVSELDLSLGVLPFAALLVLGLGLRRLPRQYQAFVAAGLALSFWLVLEVAVFASEQSFRVEERNMFYVAPFFLIALLVWIDRGMPRSGVAATAAIIVAAALPGALPYSSLIGLNAVSDTIALIPLGSLVDAGLGLDDVGLVVVFSCAVAGLVFLLVPRRYVFVLPLLVVAYFAVSQQAIEDRHHQQSEISLFGGITQAHRDWVDRVVGSDANVAVLWSGNTDKFTIWENEIFNRSLGTVYRTGRPLPGDLAETAVRIDRRTGFMYGPGGRLVRAPYVLTDGSLALQGNVIAQDAGKGIQLYRTAGPLRQIARVEGLWESDTWSKKDVVYRRLACTGGTLLVTLQGDANLFPNGNAVSAEVAGREVARTRVPANEAVTMRVPLHPSGGDCVVHFSVASTAVPAVVTNGANTDPRALGVHFNGFRFSPPARARS